MSSINNTKKDSKPVSLKYLVVGDSGVGKTSLLMKYCEDVFQTDHLSTIGVDFKVKKTKVKDIPLTLNIWDTAGQERFRNITKSFYKGAHGIVIAFAMNDATSFQHVENWIANIKQLSKEGVSMILVATKADLAERRRVSRKMGQQLAQKYGIDYLEVSAKQDNLRISEVFQKLTEKTLASETFLQKHQKLVPSQTLKARKKKGLACCN